VAAVRGAGAAARGELGRRLGGGGGGRAGGGARGAARDGAGARRAREGKWRPGGEGGRVRCAGGGSGAADERTRRRAGRCGRVVLDSHAPLGPAQSRAHGRNTPRNNPKTCAKPSSAPPAAPSLFLLLPPLQAVHVRLENGAVRLCEPRVLLGGHLDKRKGGLDGGSAGDPKAPGHHHPALPPHAPRSRSCACRPPPAPGTHTRRPEGGREGGRVGGGRATPVPPPPRLSHPLSYRVWLAAFARLEIG